MYDSDTVRERAVELVGVADEMRLLARAWMITPAADPPAAVEHVQRLQGDRSHLADAARHGLRPPSGPAS
ncbi:hypothetical protein BC342_10640 [Streptomyces olivaceus]|nr:hypothetical protein BC342_10640 [Streptomyces olivaceus]